MIVPIEEPGVWERRLAGSLVRRLLYPRRPKSVHIPPDDALRPRVRFSASDGARLVGIHYPVQDPVGIVVLVHPDKRTAKHWWSRQGITDWLNTHRLDAFAFDLSGYGESSGGNVYLHDHVVAAVEEATLLAPGLPVHLWGVSIGSYAALNAAPVLPEVEAVVLESPYPTFRAWYQATGQPIAARFVRALECTFPTTYARIDAATNAARLSAPRILLAATTADRVTPVDLSRAVAAAAPLRTRYLEVEDTDHLGLFRSSAAYRTALLQTFGAVPNEDARQTLLEPGVTPLSR